MWRGPVGRKINRREKRFLVTAAAAVFLFLAGRWFLMPFFHLATGASDLIAEQQALMEAYQSVVARENVLREERRELDAVLEQYDAFLLPSASPPLAAADLETRINDLADRSGLTIQSKKILGHRAREFFLEIPVQVVATGRIENLRDFIVLIEGSEVFIGINELHLRSMPRRNPPRGSRGRTAGSEIQATMTIAGLVPGGGETRESL
jgi:Tfp pilus assembly protein PilO